MYKIELKVQPASWSLFAARKNHKSYPAFSEKVWRRDNYACQFCGFQARDYQEVINLDQNYRNNKLQNVVTACCFCTQCFFLDAVGVGYGGGSLVYLPEISQTNLNSFCHVIFCAISNDSDYKMTAQNVYRTIKFRSRIVEEMFGEGLSDPALFAQMLVDMQNFDLSMTSTILKDIRLLPSRARFKTQIDRWAQTAMQELI